MRFINPDFIEISGYYIFYNNPTNLKLIVQWRSTFRRRIIRMLTMQNQSFIYSFNFCFSTR